ncbi:MAG: glutaminyl-peptide cyclotransferase [Blastocatellia bacterium]|nr:glutaminyl-peptide cyclotransferase [Blastocatellia bacterium]MBN8723875.1 glutaminyl-peptide cyclotransferase [Acidobacteriota bacterium]
MTISAYRLILLLSIITILTFLFIACTNAQQQQIQVGQVVSIGESMTGKYTYEIVNSWPHDIDAFTQGLIFHEGVLYESTGLQGMSSLRRVELETGKVQKKIDVPNPYFAEGMTIFQGKVYQLTWTHNKGFVYDLGSFEKEKEFSYSGEGWGLTNDGKSLILSDGTNKIRFIDPFTFEVLKTITVKEGQMPITSINELEYIKGLIYANIWQTDRIVIIDPNSGDVTGSIDLTGLLSPTDRAMNPDVLNGIAYDSAKDRLFVTGKLWPKIFEIKLKKKA